MDVLMLAQSYAPVIGGEERVVQDLSRQLVARGHSVAVATLAAASRTEDDGITVHRLKSSAYRLPIRFQDSERRHALPAPDPETVAGIRSVISRFKPDVVHAHNWLVHSYLPSRATRRPPLILSLHDYALSCATKRLFLDGGPCSGPELVKCMRCAGRNYGTVAGAGVAAMMRLSGRAVRRRVDTFIPISQAVRVGCEISTPDRYEIIPNFVGELPAPPSDSARLDSLLPREPYVLFFGDATVDKGAHHLARVYARLTDPPPLVFAGRCFIDAPGVHRTGPLSREMVIEAVRRSMCTVAPSLWAEPFGMVALEAAAAGKPVIASAIGGLLDIVDNEETGLLVAPGDEGELQHALERLIRDPDLRLRLGERARKKALQFGPDAIVPRFESVYRDAVTRSTVPALSSSL